MAARDAGIAKYKAQVKRRDPKVQLVPVQVTSATSTNRTTDKNASFGQRRSNGTQSKGKARASQQDAWHAADGGLEMSFIPSSNGDAIDDDDDDTIGEKRSTRPEKRKRGVETFGAGMEKGGDDYGGRALDESERRGRTQRRKGMRSGSKNTFRKM